MQDEEGTGHAVLLHEVLSLVDFAESELFEQKFLDLLVLNERGEGEVGSETFEDQRLVGDALLLGYFQEVFTDFVVVNASHCPDLPGFPFALSEESGTYSRMV